MLLEIHEATDGGCSCPVLWPEASKLTEATRYQPAIILLYCIYNSIKLGSEKDIKFY